uniref:Bug family tripartite tricarboxylate transporter substrate binding protein n=1 Tax=Cupriavidus yeoncheonensis TaxID=1462994 RepID=UPI003F4995A7
MESHIRQLVAAVVATTALVVSYSPNPAQAQAAWPTRPIQLIVASSAGSGTDAGARVMAKRLSESLKQPVVVDNRPGGSGVIATNVVAKAPADGYTLLYTTASNIVVAPAVMKSIPDPRKRLAPIAQTATGGILLLVSTDMPVHDLPELIQFVKAHPGKYSYGSQTVGSAGNLMMEWLKKQTGMKIDHIAYRTAPQLLTELSSGVLKVAFADPAAPVPFLRSGKVRAIAIAGNAHAPQFPAIKTMAEQGYRFDAVGWWGMFAPAGTDPAIVKRLNDEINKVQTDPGLAALMNTMNIAAPPVTTSAQFANIIDSDMTVWSKIADDAGVRIDE